MFAAILICGLNMFSSCVGSDNPVSPVNPTTNLSSKLIGKWVNVEFDGQPVLTSDKSVVTFVSSTKATISVSKTDFTETNVKWSVRRECNVKISGNKVTLTGHPEGNSSITLQDEYTITSITATEIVCKYRHTTFRNGQAQDAVTVKKARLKKINTDYRADIIGLWECEGISGGDTYNDANGRLEFFNDGTYNFYRKNDAGKWEPVTTREFQIYFVDGTLTATRWKDKGEDEHRECWEIKSLKGDQMVWTALRQNDDGSTFQQEVKWKKIDPAEHGQLLEVYDVQGSAGKARLTVDGKVLFETDVFVGKNGLGKTGEGDGKTPIGTLHPLTAFGVKPNPGTTMPYIDVKPTTYACDENCEYYNQIIDTAETKHDCKGEEMYSYQPQYNYGIATDFNKECIYPNGSAIFIHVKGTKTYTGGCIAFDEDRMVEILKNCDMSLVIIIKE